MNYGNKYVLQAKVRVSDKMNGRVRERIVWKDVESADSKVPLMNLVPIGREKDFQIVELDEVPKVDKVEFSKRLNAIMDSRRVSAETAAEMCDISPDVIRAYKRGEKMPKVKNLNKLCKGLNVSVEELTGVRK